jgi:hypothetical protein
METLYPDQQGQRSARIVKIAGIENLTPHGNAGYGDFACSKKSAEGARSARKRAPQIMAILAVVAIMAIS